MNTAAATMPFTWTCKKSWLKSAKNTFWCLVGCTLGNYATIGLFQIFAPHTPSLLILIIGPLVGLATSVSFESLLLMKQMTLQQAFKVAVHMSFINMIVMQVIANLVNLLLVGHAHLTWWSIIPSLLAGFLSVWPYNYYKIKKYGQSCH